MENTPAEKEKTMSFRCWLENHYKQAPIDNLRLGQRFVNDFIKESWPELFYETNEHEAIHMIVMWLQHYHYQYDSLPQKVR